MGRVPRRHISALHNYNPGVTLPPLRLNYLCMNTPWTYIWKKKKSAPSRGHAMNTQLQNLKYRHCLVSLTVRILPFLILSFQYGNCRTLWTDRDAIRTSNEWLWLIAKWRMHFPKWLLLIANLEAHHFMKHVCKIFIILFSL